MPNPIVKENITGLILCGGAGRRMGGADKGLLEFKGKTLVDIAIERLEPQVHVIIISANRNREIYAKRGRQIIADKAINGEQQHFDGPLAGILAGLAAMQTDWLLVVPCDCPKFPLDLAAELGNALNAQLSHDASRHRNQIMAAYAQDHPVFVLLSKTCQPALAQYLEDGRRKLGDWLNTIDAIATPFPNESAFINMNQPENLNEIK